MSQTSFMTPPAEFASPDSVARRRKVAEAMMQGGIDTSPVGHPFQAIARVLQAGIGGYNMHKADQAEKAGTANAYSKITDALMTGQDTSPEMMADVASDEWVNPAMKAMMLQRYADRSKPKDRIEVGGRLLNPDTLEVEYEPPKEPEKPQVVPRNSRLYQDGQWIAPPADQPGMVDVDPDRQDRITQQFEGSNPMDLVNTTVPILQSLEKSLNDPRATADIDFIYGPSKIVDPTGSVRDADAAAMQFAQSLPAAWRGEVLKALKGEGKLPREVRMGLYDIARRRVEGYVDRANSLRGHYQKTAPGYELPEVPELSKWQDQNMQMPEGGMPPVQQGAPQTDMPPPPPGVDPLEWQHMTPEERALWNQ